MNTSEGFSEQWSLLILLPKEDVMNLNCCRLGMLPYSTDWYTLPQGWISLVTQHTRHPRPHRSIRLRGTAGLASNPLSPSHVTVTLLGGVYLLSCGRGPWSPVLLAGPASTGSQRCMAVGKTTVSSSTRMRMDGQCLTTCYIQWNLSIVLTV